MHVQIMFSLRRRQTSVLLNALLCLLCGFLTCADAIVPGYSAGRHVIDKTKSYRVGQLSEISVVGQFCNDEPVWIELWTETTVGNEYQLLWQTELHPTAALNCSNREIKLEDNAIRSVHADSDRIVWLGAMMSSPDSLRCVYNSTAGDLRFSYDNFLLRTIENELWSMAVVGETYRFVDLRFPYSLPVFLCSAQDCLKGMMDRTLTVEKQMSVNDMSKNAANLKMNNPERSDTSSGGYGFQPEEGLAKWSSISADSLIALVVDYLETSNRSIPTYKWDSLDAAERRRFAVKVLEHLSVFEMNETSSYTLNVSVVENWTSRDRAPLVEGLAGIMLLQRIAASETFSRRTRNSSIAVENLEQQTAKRVSDPYALFEIESTWTNMSKSMDSLRNILRSYPDFGKSKVYARLPVELSSARFPHLSEWYNRTVELLRTSLRELTEHKLRMQLLSGNSRTTEDKWNEILSAAVELHAECTDENDAPVTAYVNELIDASKQLAEVTAVLRVEHGVNGFLLLGRDDDSISLVPSSQPINENRSFVRLNCSDAQLFTILPAPSSSYAAYFESINYARNSSGLCRDLSFALNVTRLALDLITDAVRMADERLLEVILAILADVQQHQQTSGFRRTSGKTPQSEIDDVTRHGDFSSYRRWTAARADASSSDVNKTIMAAFDENKRNRAAVAAPEFSHRGNLFLAANESFTKTPSTDRGTVTDLSDLHGEYTGHDASGSLNDRRKYQTASETTTGKPRLQSAVSSEYIHEGLAADPGLPVNEFQPIGLLTQPSQADNIQTLDTRVSNAATNNGNLPWTSLPGNQLSVTEISSAQPGSTTKNVTNTNPDTNQSATTGSDSRETATSTAVNRNWIKSDVQVGKRIDVTSTTLNVNSAGSSNRIRPSGAYNDDGSISSTSTPLRSNSTTSVHYAAAATIQNGDRLSAISPSTSVLSVQGTTFWSASPVAGSWIVDNTVAELVADEVGDDGRHSSAVYTFETSAGEVSSRRVSTGAGLPKTTTANRVFKLRPEMVTEQKRRSISVTARRGEVGAASTLGEHTTATGLVVWCVVATLLLICVVIAFLAHYSNRSTIRRRFRGHRRDSYEFYSDEVESPSA